MALCVCAYIAGVHAGVKNSVAQQLHCLQQAREFWTTQSKPIKRTTRQQQSGKPLQPFSFESMSQYVDRTRRRSHLDAIS